MLFLPHEEGQGLVEYAFLIVLVALVVLILVVVLGQGTKNLYVNVIEAV